MVPLTGVNAAQRREYDKKVGSGTMSKSGGACPCCSTIMTWEDLRFEGSAHRFGNVLHSVVCEGAEGKEFRLPTDDELNAASDAANHLDEVFSTIPFGIPREPTPGLSGARLDGSDAPHLRILTSGVISSLLASY